MRNKPIDLPGTKRIGSGAIRAALMYAGPLKNHKEPEPQQQAQMDDGDDFPVGWDEVEEALKR